MESKICRVCLDRTATISLFEQHDSVPYREKILKCVSVTIEEGDGFPDSICENCAAELSISYEFAQKCEASDRALRCLGLLQTTDLSEPLKTEPKLEPHEITPECADEALHYDDLEDDQISESKYDPVIAPIIKEIKKEKVHKKDTRALQHKRKRRVPNHLRKIKPKVFSGRIQCNVCGLILKCQSAHEVHLRTHTKEKPFSCDLCLKRFATKHSVKTHIYRHSEFKLNPLPDRDSRKTINKIKRLHILCVLCGMKVQSRSALESHMRTHTGEKPFNCSKCDKRYKNKNSLKIHIQSAHTKDISSSYICEHCGKTFYSKTSIKIHLCIHTGEKRYVCAVCQRRFTQHASLARHARLHTGERPYACPVCDKTFRDSTMLQNHKYVHRETKDFVCHICNGRLKSKLALKAHVNRHNNPEKYVCNICGTTFNIKGNLNLHLKRMHSEKSGTCTECHKTFPNLAAHMRTHSGEKVFLCKVCQQRFMTKRSLTHHMRIKHRDTAKFKCSMGQCDKAFPMIHMLEFHMLKAHLDSTPYVCAHCARGFLRPCDLSRHLKLNHMLNVKVTSQFIKTVKTSPPT